MIGIRGTCGTLTINITALALKIYNILNKLSDKRVAPVITMVLYFGIDKETVEVALTCL